MGWPNQMPNLNAARAMSPSRMHQNSTDQLDETESLLLSEANFNPEDIENLFDDEMMSNFEDCLREEGLGSNFAPTLEANLGDNSLDSIVPTTSAFLSTNLVSASSHSLLAKKLSRPELQLQHPSAKISFDESNSKVANFMARIPFRSTTKFPTRSYDLDFNYSAEINVGLHLRKFDYFQLSKWSFTE
jgi:hypothetical protein